VRHGDHRAGVLLQEALEPRDRLRIEMVGRLVEQQKIRRLQQQPAERNPAAFAARKLGDVGVRRRQAQRVHRVLEPRIEIPGVRRVDLVLQLALLVEDLVHLLRREILAELRVDLVVARQERLMDATPSIDVAEDVLRRVELRLLMEKPDGNPRAGKRLAEEARVLTGHDLQQRAFPRAVQAKDADFGAEIKGQPDIVEHAGVGRVHLPETLHRIDKFRHGRSMKQ